MARAKFSAQQVANYFLEKGEHDGIDISPLKLIKLAYIAYGWVLALTKERLFDDQIQAWQHGPVIPSLYHEFKHFKSEAITERAGSFDLDSFSYVTPRIPDSEDDFSLILDRVWASYKHVSGWALRNKTHASGSPWDTVYKDGQRNICIPDSLIESHYRERIAEYLDAAKQV